MPPREQQGARAFLAVEGGKRSCADLSGQDFERVGEFVMGRMAGSTSASVCRAVRNSSHGLLDILRDHDDRFLLGANTGGIPAELPALAPLIAIGLLADTEGLIDGSWKTKLVARQ